MKFLKKVVFLLLSLIALVLIVALFLNKETNVERSITIDLPKAEVFEYVRYLKNQDNYGVWQQMDPKMNKSYSGEDGTVGFISTWKSENENVGSGEQEITKIVEDSRIETKLRFKEPWESESDAYFDFKSTGNQTEVTWGFHGITPYPWNVMLLFMDMDEMLGKDLEGGLNNLKKVLESNSLE